MIDPDALLQPIEGDSAVGIDLHSDPKGRDLLSELKSAHSTARSAERSLRDRRAIDPSAAEGSTRTDWQTVETMACKLLETRSKDMHVAAYLMEAAIHTDGFRGLAAGAAVAAGLIDRYWNDLYPGLAPAETDDSGGGNSDRFARRLLRLKNLGQTGGVLASEVYSIPLFISAAGKPVSLFDAEEARRWTGFDAEQRTKWLKDNGARRGYRNDNLPRGWSDLCKEATANGTAALAATRSDITAALRNWQALSDALSARVGGDRLSTSDLSGLLRQTLNAVNEWLPPPADDAPETPPPTEAGPAGTEPDPAPAPRRAAGGPISNREDALRSLQEVTAFFRRAEPVSPVGYALEEIVRRARLTWPELLAEIEPDDKARQMILTRLGIQPTKGP